MSSPPLVGKPYKMMRRLANVSPEEAEKLALSYFLEEFGHYAVDIPIATDNRLTQQYSRFKLREFLKERAP